MQNSTQPTRNTLNLSIFHGKLQQETPLITGTATTPLRRLTDRAGAAARTRESRAAGSTIERHDAKAMNGRCSETADAQDSVPGLAVPAPFHLSFHPNQKQNSFRTS